MNILIIEDEMPAYKRLNKIIHEVIPGTHGVTHIDSVQRAKEWFDNEPCPDIVFLDIQLSDGSAFDLLKKVNIECPIIFTTAYDEYAMDAYKTNSIDYLLKPVKKDELERAYQKLQHFKKVLNEHVVMPQETPQQDYKKRFLIRFGEHIKTIAVADIAYCYSESKVTFAKMIDGRNYPIDNNLDTLEMMLDPQEFFRINRQYIVSLKAIDEMRTYTKARVIIKLNPVVKENPVVSSERAATFKAWLAGEYKA